MEMFRNEIWVNILRELVKYDSEREKDGKLSVEGSTLWS